MSEQPGLTKNTGELDDGFEVDVRLRVVHADDLRQADGVGLTQGANLGFAGEAGRRNGRFSNHDDPSSNGWPVNFDKDGRFLPTWAYVGGRSLTLHRLLAALGR
jgi:hypothetical protein